MEAHDKLNDLAQRKLRIQQGDSEGVRAHKESGKLLARERIALLLDANSFVELDALVSAKDAPGEGVVTGYGTIEGRAVYVYAQDHTALGGAMGRMQARKILKVMDLAVKCGAPILSLLDSAGARAGEGMAALNAYGEVFAMSAKISGVVPQIAAVLGPCAGGAAMGAALADICVMVDGLSSLHIWGPQVIAAVTDKAPDASLGSAKMHAERSGLAHLVARDEEQCMEMVRSLIGVLPSNNLEDSIDLLEGDDINRLIPQFDSFGAQLGDMRPILASVADAGSFLELGERFAASVITAFARIGGRAIGLVANQPAVDGGALSGKALDKAARFVRLCDAFNIPVVTFVDTPGFVVDSAEEENGLAAKAAKLVFAYAEASVPKLTVVVGRAFAATCQAMASKAVGADMVLAWPSAQLFVLPPDTAANFLFADEIAASSDPIMARSEKARYVADVLADPVAAAADGSIDDVIVPSQTRQRLASALDMLLSKRESGFAKKHGNLPL